MAALVTPSGGRIDRPVVRSRLEMDLFLIVAIRVQIRSYVRSYKLENIMT